MKAPTWVVEEEFIQHVLHTMLDKLGNGVRPYIRVNEKNAPQLYKFNEEDTEYLWGLLTLLDTEYHVVSIKKPNKHYPEAHYHRSQLYLVEENIPVIREWLGRPELDNYSIVWQEMVKEFGRKLIVKYGESAGFNFNALMDSPLRYGNRSAEQLARAFCTIPRHLTKPTRLRTLSAQCFWGDSKFLDKRVALLETVFPQFAHFVKNREILINAYVPENYTEVLFIENQDSFVSMVEAAELHFPDLALIYSAGFRGSAQGVRAEKAVIWSLVNQASASAHKKFVSWWCGELQKDIPVHFWGDLDYSAVAILAALKRSFPGLQAWQPGYEAMLELHAKEVCHAPDDARKENQRPPDNTGCKYADENLLPLLKSSVCFVDQEAVDIEQIK